MSSANAHTLRVAMSLAVMLAAAPLVAQRNDTPRYARDVRPILAKNCFACHGFDAAHRKADLRLDVREKAVNERWPRKGQGAKRRAAIVPGNAAKSLLIELVESSEPRKRMPPPSAHEALSSSQIDVLRRWIDAGAKYEAHWAYRPLVARKAPRSRKGDAWSRSYVDAWIFERLTREGVAPSRLADAVTLVRRLYLDLTGLAPTPQEVDAFVRDQGAGRPGEPNAQAARDAAYGRLVDRLLASKEHAERLASWWLDLVRYADTVGYHGDQEHRISPYRDWVLEALYADMPFDRFTELQLAGDLQPNASEGDRVASGYNRLLQTTHEGGAQPKEYLAIYAADRVRNFGSVWLAHTTGCAQCHDHKYDPISTKDFYELAAFFADIEEVGDFKGSPNSTPTTRPPEILLIDDASRAELVRLDAAIKARRKAAGKNWRKDQKLRQLQNQRRRVEARGRWTMITRARKTPRTTRLLARGNWLDESGEIVQPRAPQFLPQIAKSDRATRRDLARWLFRSDNPLPARVVVNRLWQLLFGRGLAPALDDFGVQGGLPSHPELLDALAIEFRESGWSLRRVIRRIVTSSSYRQASLPRSELADRDPANTLVARQGRWRLPAEAVRDHALAVSGLLVRQFGGASVKPYQPAGYYRHLNFPPRRYRVHKDARQWRRGVYVHWQRQFLHPMLKAFDAPTREECCAERSRSNTPQAALTLLNDPTFVEAARGLGQRLLDYATPPETDPDRARLVHAWRLATARTPIARELQTLTKLLHKRRREFAANPSAAKALLEVGFSAARAGQNVGDSVSESAAWTSVARVVLNLAETYARN